MKKTTLSIALPLAILVELAGLGATIYGYVAMRRNAEEVDAARFATLKDEQVAEIRARLESYESVLYGGIGMLNGSRDVSVEQWRSYVMSMPLEQMAPGILGIGTIVPVTAADRERVVAEMDELEAELEKFRYMAG